MPAKIPMIISNGGFRSMKTFIPTTSKNLGKTFTQTTTNNLAKTSIPNSKPASLTSSMISRIHNIKPGCGSCGR